MPQHYYLLDTLVVRLAKFIYCFIVSLENAQNLTHNWRFQHLPIQAAYQGVERWIEIP